MLGDALLNHFKYVTGHCPDAYDPTLEDGWRKLISLDSEACIISIVDRDFGRDLDPASSTAFSEQSVRDADGAIVLYSADSLPSFERAKVNCQRTKSIRELAQQPAMPICVMGMKSKNAIQATMSAKCFQDLYSDGGFNAVECYSTIDHVDQIQSVFHNIARSVLQARKFRQTMSSGHEMTVHPDKVKMSIFRRLSSGLGLKRSQK